jgi:hypothetical protein
MLEYHAGANFLVFSNEYADLVTALPYIDDKVDEAYKGRVQDLIKEEMRAMGQAHDYLEKLPMPQLSQLVSFESFKCEGVRLHQG